MALAGVFTSAAVIAGIAAPMGLALVHAFADMLLAAFRCLVVRNHTAGLRADKNATHCAEQ
jgi:hypothetical protein